MAKVVVYHSGYGCDTGCTGHVVELQDNNGVPTSQAFDFLGPATRWTDDGRLERTETDREYAERIVTEEFGAEHVKDLDWDHCRIVDD